DKSILLQLSDPLAHLLRNCLDHGIERPYERRSAGKPPAGVVELRAARAKNQVEITMEDDGRGIDPEAVRRGAVARGLLGEEESLRLGAPELFACLFRPGFSTRDEVTEVSGRGVGLDVVKSRVEALGGVVEVSSRPGSGTRFRLAVPLSVAIVPVLTVGVGESVVALPVASIDATLEAHPRDVRETEAGPVLATARGEFPFFRLAEVLKLEGRGDPERLPFVLLRGPSGTSALAVDRFLREEDLFIKPLKGPLSRLPRLAGYSVMGDGTLVFLLDPATLRAA
ncbi:MAG: hypothetical protein HGA98_03920, partial [Deltaproteobacteria bacterium]|nr:hypothetical protein [Deltaproteobacteria bacterium]